MSAASKKRAVGTSGSGGGGGGSAASGEEFDATMPVPVGLITLADCSVDQNRELLKTITEALGLDYKKDTETALYDKLTQLWTAAHSNESSSPEKKDGSLFMRKLTEHREMPKVSLAEIIHLRGRGPLTAFDGGFKGDPNHLRNKHFVAYKAGGTTSLAVRAKKCEAAEDHEEGGGGGGGSGTGVTTEYEIVCLQCMKPPFSYAKVGVDTKNLFCSTRETPTGASHANCVGIFPEPLAEFIIARFPTALEEFNKKGGATPAKTNPFARLGSGATGGGGSAGQSASAASGQ